MNDVPRGRPRNIIRGRTHKLASHASTNDISLKRNLLARLTNRSALFHRGFPVCVLSGAFVSVWAGENSDVHAAFVVTTLNAPVTSIKLVFKAVPSHTSAPRLGCCIFGHCQSTVNTGRCLRSSGFGVHRHTKTTPVQNKCEFDVERFLPRRNNVRCRPEICAMPHGSPTVLRSEPGQA
jgi:hypothetical protein